MGILKKNTNKYVFEFRNEGKIVEEYCDKWAANEIRTGDIVYPIFLLLNEEKDQLIFKPFDSFVGARMLTGGNEFFESLKSEIIVDDYEDDYVPEGYN